MNGITFYDNRAARMEQTRIAALLTPFVQTPLASRQLEQLAAYLDLLLKWNARINLTAVRDAEQIISRHFGESLFAAEQLLRDHPVQTAIDVGSGAGFPGLPLAIFAPQVNVTLIESQNKKATFLKEVGRSLSLANAAVFHGRAEEWKRTAGLVTMRAVEKFADTLPVAATLVGSGGRLALLIGAEQAPTAANSIPTFHWADPVPIPESRQRILMLGRAPV
jgi:16S rRNA (guanine527-N7)-methyltransferase